MIDMLRSLYGIPIRPMIQSLYSCSSRLMFSAAAGSSTIIPICAILVSISISLSVCFISLSPRGRMLA